MSEEMSDERTVEVPITLVPFLRMAQVDWFPEGARPLISLATPAKQMATATYGAVLASMTEQDVVIRTIERATGVRS
jgi:hypothetical protein